ncbi:MAG: FHA domain-containing protein [Anaerolineae bacterium]|nr:FHA domain-containing protein [Anaerolineae bacterium]
MDILLLILRLLLTFLLYAFLGIAFYTLWCGLRQNEHSAPAPQPTAQLVITAGNESGKHITLRPVMAIGRGEDNALILNDPFTSTHHALIVWREDQWWLEDLESHNGTLLNDARISQPTPLCPGDLICIGETVFRFEMEIEEGKATK